MKNVLRLFVCLFISVPFFFSVFGNSDNLCSKSIIKFVRPQEIISLIKKYLPINPVILEAGAYDGTDTVFLADYFGPHCKVYSFEPVPYLYDIAKKNTHKNPNIFLYNLALADSCETKPFYLSNLGNNPTTTASSSLLKPKKHLTYCPGIYFTSQINVQCTTIDQWSYNNNVEKIDFLWLDLQGSELDVMKASPNILKNVKVILTEIEFVEAYEGQALYQEVKKWLEDQGFTLIALNDVPRWFGDALFIRN